MKIIHGRDKAIWRIGRAAIPDPGRRRLIRGGATASLALTLAACSGLQIIDAVTPEAGYDRVADIPYGVSSRQSFDIYIPADRGARSLAPVVVFFYGGSWRQGAKETYRFIGAYLARAGYVAVLCDYRLYPEVRFPGFVEDCAAATAFVRRVVAGYGGDPARLFLMGHSAGAHMAALLALEPSYLAEVGFDAGDLAGIVGISGPYDHDFGTVRWLAPVFPDARSRSAARVVDKARRGAPPMFLANGTGDTLVPARNAVALGDRLRGLGNRVEVRLYDGAGHGDILLGFTPALAGASTIGFDVVSFLAEA
jgi:acetyl esterase/lipase